VQNIFGQNKAIIYSFKRRVRYSSRKSGKYDHMYTMTYSQLRQYITTMLTQIVEPVEATAEAKRWLKEGLGLSLSWIIAHGEAIVPTDSLCQIENWLYQRLQGKPWSYIIGWTSFLDRRYYVTPDTLIPRPETEILLSFALDLGKKLDIQRACDVGTGSGIIAISMALSTNWNITATDISIGALRIAQKNANSLQANVKLYHGDLLAEVPDPIGLVVSNPPYINPGDKLTLKNELMFEPQIALFADNQGLAITKRLLDQAFKRSAYGCAIEIGSGQGYTLRNHALTTGWNQVEIHKDLAGHDRVLLAW
jgi:release factor glutamine methyltransferase